MKRRYSFHERVDQLREFCHIRINHAVGNPGFKPDFTVGEYAEWAGLSPSYVRRLIWRAYTHSIINVTMVPGHNGIDKITIDPLSIDQPDLYEAKRVRDHD